MRVSFFLVLMQLDPPAFILRPNDLVLMKNESGASHCKVSGKPIPTITWYKDEEPVLDDEHIQIECVPCDTGYEVVSVLKYSQAVPERYDGNYQVHAVNESGKAVYDVKILGKSKCSCLHIQTFQLYGKFHKIKWNFPIINFM